MTEDGNLLADMRSGTEIMENISGIDPKTWGPWRLSAKDRTLFVGESADSCRYYVDLERCANSAQVLDWICHVSGKTWVDDATLAGLVRALDDVLSCRACLCPDGQSRTINRGTLIALIRQAADAGAPQ